MRRTCSLSVLCFALVLTAQAAETPPEVRRGTWLEALVAGCQALAERGDPNLGRRPLPDFGRAELTVSAWIQTTAAGTILAKAPEQGPWVPQGKALFVGQGKVVFDIGWVGAITSRRAVADGRWHHVALVISEDGQQLYIDGQADAAGNLRREPDKAPWVVKIGRTSDDFGGDFHGLLDDVRLYARALTAAEIKAHSQGSAAEPDGSLVGHWPFDGTGQDASGSRNPVLLPDKCEFAAGKLGRALMLAGGGAVIASGASDPLAAIWAQLQQDFPDEVSRGEMNWERQDAIWDGAWKPGDWRSLAQRYAQATARLAASQAGPQAQEAGATRLAAAAAVKDRAGALAVRELYLQQRRRGEALKLLAAFDLPNLRAMISGLQVSLGSRYPQAARHLARLDELEQQGVQLVSGATGARSSADASGLTQWEAAVTALRRQALVADNPLVDFDQIVFVKRLTYSSNHYYTEYINAAWTPGGNLCVLNLKDGSVRELVPQLQGGVFERFDLSFDAQRIVFAWKAGPQVGYRIYEVQIDGSGLRQLTFPQADEAELVRKYRVYPHYHHGTDDMQPCYLPDGGIAFISTRCQYGILCDAPDDFTTTVLYRIDADGQNLRKLSNSSVSEASPVMLPDGRILYTRWEYVDKGAVSVKCLWAMRPDGTASSEIYGNDISLPPTMIYGRPLPNSANKYVVLGTPHCPQNGVGTVIRLDMTKDIRSRDPMTYMTPYVDIQAEPGFAFRKDGQTWTHDGDGRGPLFKDPYPLSDDQFLVAHKPEGSPWLDPKGYGLYLLDEQGRTSLIYRDPAISCWLPFPLKPRQAPRLLPSERNAELAEKHLAACVVSDVYHGLKDVPRGTIKYIRVLEQIPRPWAARRRWGGDEYDQQHACITKDTHLGLKVQHGIVPVEDDGSASFLVPAESNIFLQVLDANYLAVQTERTFVNYMPGEVRSCVGCHETPNHVAPTAAVVQKKAMQRPPSIPGPQPGEVSGRRALDYATDVQPVWDRHCLECHSGTKLEGGLDLSGRLTTMFNVSYESLVPERRRGQFDRRLLGPVIGENHPKTGNVDYLPARSLGSHASVLMALLAPEAIHLQDPAAAERARKQAEVHRDIKLTQEELLRVSNWVDTNCQYYGTYWGRKNLQYRERPDFRPRPTFEMATSMSSPLPEQQ